METTVKGEVIRHPAYAVRVPLALLRQLVLDTVVDLGVPTPDLEDRDIYIFTDDSEFDPEDFSPYNADHTLSPTCKGAVVFVVDMED